MKIFEYVDKKLYCYDLEFGKKNLDIIEKLTDNDRHKSFKVKGSIEVEGNLYLNEKPTKKEISTSKTFIKESLIDYHKKMEILDVSNYQWILNIIDGKNESQQILKEYEEFLLVKDYVWKNHSDTSQLHLLAITKDRSLRSVRDLNESHVSMLKEIKNNVLQFIKENYDIESNKIKVMFHYPPSTYILHIHFRYMDHYDYGTSFERCFRLDDVIFHLENNTKYFERELEIIS